MVVSRWQNTASMCERLAITDQRPTPNTFPRSTSIFLSLPSESWRVPSNVRAAALGVYPDVLAGAFDHACHLAANGIAKPNMRNQTFAEKCVNAVTGAVEKLIWDYEIERLVFFL